MPKTESAIHFTKRSIENIPAPNEARVYWYDAGQDSLALCCTPNGAKTFYCCHRANGRYKRLRLGKFPDLSVEQARKLAKAALGEVASGFDPHASRQVARHEHTMAGLWDYWLESYAKPHKTTWKEDERQYNTFLKPWASRRLASITRADVEALHRRVGENNGHYAGNRLLRLLCAMFNKATVIGYQGVNPAAGIPKFKESSRDRYLLPDELPKFFQALEAEPSENLRDFFKVALFTGARRANVQMMKWEEMDLTSGTWRIPKTKSGEPVLIHLSAEIIELLKQRRERSKSDWVFPSHSKTGHLVEPRSAWLRITTRAGLKDIRIHDLRRTLGSWAAATGASLPIIGKLLGHKSQGSTAVYARLAIDPARQASDIATTAILAAANAKPAEPAEPKAASKKRQAKNGKA